MWRQLSLRGTQIADLAVAGVLLVVNAVLCFL